MPQKSKNRAKGNKKIRAEKTSWRNKRRIIPLFILAALFSIVATEISYLLYKIDYVKVITAKIEVGTYASFALGEEKFDVINFGTMMPGNSGSRFITVENQNKKEIFMRIFVAGKIKGFLAYDNNQIITANETKKITFDVYVPENAGKGKYNGRIFLIFKKI